MKRLIIAAALLAACSGCNTVSGLGKDLQTVGGVVAGTAEGVQKGASPPPASAQPPPPATPSELCAPNADGQKPSGCPV